ncbi:MAG: HU family DNA-binding protein [Myxococcota bacterium]
MNRSELVEEISKDKALPRKAADAAVSAVFDTIFEAIKEDERVEIRGFGSFTTRHYDAYTGRNPRTGEPVDVAAKRLPFFKVGKDLRKRVDR